MSSLPQAVLGQDEEDLLPPGEEAGGLVPDQAGEERPGQTRQVGARGPPVLGLRLEKTVSDIDNRVQHSPQASCMSGYNSPSLPSPRQRNSWVSFL